MARLLYSASISLDGFVAGPGGDMSWLAPFFGPNPLVDGLVPRVGSIIAGWNSFAGDDPLKGQLGEGEPFGGGFEGEQFVLTHRDGLEGRAGVTFVHSLDEAVSRASEAAGDRYVNVIGPGVARQLIETGQLDEILVGIVPLLLGGGVRLFDRVGAPVRLERMTVNVGPQSTDAWFRVVH